MEGSCEKKQKFGCLRFGCVLISAVFVLVLAIIAAAVAFVAVQMKNSSDEVETVVSEFAAKGDKIAVIPVENVISFDDSYSAASPEQFEKMLAKAEKSADVKAVILSINSPGGEVTASDDMYRMLLAFRKRSKKPVIALMNSIAASGAFYVAMGCDRIIASPMTLTGSIGVIISSYNLKGLADKIGVQREVYKSGKMKDMLDPLKVRTPEESAVVTHLVQESYLAFAAIVANSRKLPLEAITKGEIGDGRVLTAKQALDAKLIDGLGRMPEACRLAEKLSKVQEHSLSPVKYKRKLPFLDLFRESRAGKGELTVSLPGMNRRVLPEKGYLFYLPPDLIR